MTLPFLNIATFIYTLFGLVFVALSIVKVIEMGLTTIKKAGDA
jgi:hypothetical protein